jgi:hypothetical protein
MRLGSSTIAFVGYAAAATLAAACSKDPNLNVQTASASETPAAQVQPAHSTQTPAGGAAEAGQQLPPGHPAVAPGAAGGAMGGFDLQPVDPNAGRGQTGLAWNAPESWLAQPPSNSMRRAQYQVPGPGGNGECVVFYFGPGQGGAPMENAQRWAGQFAQPGGKNPLEVMKTRMGEAGGVPVLFVETTGTYVAGAMMGGPTEAKQGWALLGAVVEGADANWFFKFTGPAKTIEAQRAAFDAMITSVRRGG